MYLMSLSSSILAVFRSTCPGPQPPDAVWVGEGSGEGVLVAVWVGLGEGLGVEVSVGDGLGVDVLVGEGAAATVAALGANSSVSPLQSSATSVIFDFSAESTESDHLVFT